jgi:hypothetical protein
LMSIVRAVSAGTVIVHLVALHEAATPARTLCPEMIWVPLTQIGQAKITVLRAINTRSECVRLRGWTPNPQMMSPLSGSIYLSGMVSGGGVRT